jgi:hypothetical protein
MSALAKRRIDGSMLSWTLGGYPSPNLQVAEYFAKHNDATIDEVLNALATGRYGSKAAPYVRQAWSAFSKGFREFPYNEDVLYRAPQQFGPSNLLTLAPTGYSATMSCFPYDDLDGWRGNYPRYTFANQFRKVADYWAQGLPFLQNALAVADSSHRAVLHADLGLAEAAWCHFASVANQASFIIARDTMQSPTCSEDEANLTHHEMMRLLDEEIRLAQKLYDLTRQDSRIGFEASNQYFYTPLDLVEKVLNCEFIRQQIATHQ